MALLQLVDKIHTALEKKEFAWGIFLDHHHDIVLAKMYRYGFHGSGLVIIFNREQYVNHKVPF